MSQIQILRCALLADGRAIAKVDQTSLILIFENGVEPVIPAFTPCGFFQRVGLVMRPLVIL